MRMKRGNSFFFFLSVLPVWTLQEMTRWRELLFCKKACSWIWLNFTSNLRTPTLITCWYILIIDDQSPRPRETSSSSSLFVTYNHTGCTHSEMMWNVNMSWRLWRDLIKGIKWVFWWNGSSHYTDMSDSRSTEDWYRASSHGATTITWSSISAKPMSWWWSTRGPGGPCPGSHPGRGSEEGGFIQEPWGPNQSINTIDLTWLCYALLAFFCCMSINVSLHWQKQKNKKKVPCMCSHVWPIKLILIEHKVVAVTVDNTSNMNAAAKTLQILKHGCFIHILNPAAQKISTITTVSRWTPESSVTSSVSDQIWSQSPLLFRSCVEKWPKKCLSGTLWCHSEADLWPFG